MPIAGYSSNGSEPLATSFPKTEIATKECCVLPNFVINFARFLRHRRSSPKRFQHLQTLTFGLFCFHLVQKIWQFQQQ